MKDIRKDIYKAVLTIRRSEPVLYNNMVEQKVIRYGILGDETMRGTKNYIINLCLSL